MVPHTAGAPFTLTPVQEADLNRFLEDWEKVSATYKRFECKFYCFTYGVAFTEGKTDKLEKDIPDYVTYGWLRYSAPNRGAYEVTGEVTGSANNRIEVDFDKKAKRADEHIDGRRVKYLSTGEEIHNFDFADSKVYIYRVPKDQQTGIATGGPMPLVFGAKAADLRKRYYLRLVTPESSVKRNEIWLEAYPRNEDDAAEFKCVHLVVDRKERIPKAFIKYSVNGTQRDVYEFDISSLKINSRWDTLMEATFFDPNRVPGNWTKVNIETPPEAAAPQQRGVAQGNPQQRPGNVPAPKNVAPNRPIGTQVTGTPQNQRPPQNRVQAPKSEEIELYTPPETKGRPTF